MNPFKIMSDSYGRLGLYKRFAPSNPGGMEGWELVATEAEFPSLREALKQAEGEE